MSVAITARPHARAWSRETEAPSTREQARYASAAPYQEGTSSWATTPGESAYGLIGFSADGSRLYGWETGGEAEWWQRPVAVDLASGVLSTLPGFPTDTLTGIGSSNATFPLERIAGGSGAALGQPLMAKGDPEWAAEREPRGLLWASLAAGSAGVALWFCAADPGEGAGAVLRRGGALAAMAVGAWLAGRPDGRQEYSVGGCGLSFWAAATTILLGAVAGIDDGARLWPLAARLAACSATVEPITEPTPTSSATSRT
jgi:hypothetical protein